MTTDFVLDFETLGKSADSVVLSLGITFYDRDEVKTFNEYLDDTYYFKFDVNSQTDTRSIDQDTLDWWSKQDLEVQSQQLIPDKNDITLDTFLVKLKELLSKHNVNRQSVGFARGKEFDFGILTNIVTHYEQELGINPVFFPVPFWQRKDIRDYISGLMVDPMITKVPLPKGSLDGFKHHDPVHDCARAVMHIKYAEMYARGDIEVPDEVDSNSNK